MWETEEDEDRKEDEDKKRIKREDGDRPFILCLVVVIFRTLQIGAVDRIRKLKSRQDVVTFEVEPGDQGGIRCTKYHPQDEEPVVLPRTVGTTDFIQYLLDKSGRSMEDILERGTVRINIKLSDFQMFIVKPTNCPTLVESMPGVAPVSPQAEEARTLLLRMFELQEEHMIQQSEWMSTIASTMQAVNKSRVEMVKPDTFDGCSSSPECWILTRTRY